MSLMSLACLNLLLAANARRCMLGLASSPLGLSIGASTPPMLHPTHASAVPRLRQQQELHLRRRQKGLHGMRQGRQRRRRRIPAVPAAALAAALAAPALALAAAAQARAARRRACRRCLRPIFAVQQRPDLRGRLLQGRPLPLKGLPSRQAQVRCERELPGDVHGPRGRWGQLLQAGAPPCALSLAASTVQWVIGCTCTHTLCLLACCPVWLSVPLKACLPPLPSACRFNRPVPAGVRHRLHVREEGCWNIRVPEAAQRAPHARHERRNKEGSWRAPLSQAQPSRAQPCAARGLIRWPAWCYASACNLADPSFPSQLQLPLHTQVRMHLYQCWRPNLLGMFVSGGHFHALSGAHACSLPQWQQAGKALLFARFSSQLGHAMFCQLSHRTRPLLPKYLPFLFLPLRPTPCSLSCLRAWLLCPSVSPSPVSVEAPLQPASLC
jgi:hypothetical protein